ncbi:alpha-2-macroglobulin family protein [Halovulum sp. GXIMD14794]
MHRPILILTAMLALATGVHAQTEPVPSKRPVFEQDVDFYGGDLRAIFDTTIGLCRTACQAEQTCRAFTYNTRAAACFLKTDVTRRDPYQGAISALMLPTEPGVIAQAQARAAALGFLQPGDIGAAREQAERIAMDFRGGSDAEARLTQARSLAQAGDPRGAMQQAGVAVALADRSDMWIAFSQYANAVETDDYSERRRLRREALLSAINGWLRAPDGSAQATAAQRLAEALEAADDGRRSIDALQLALESGPRRDLEAALERARNLYGFRVTDTNVDSDAASPRVCVSFSEPLVAGAIDYADYVQLPIADLSVSAQDRQLCIEGASHGSRLSFTLRAGLPSVSGEALVRSVEQSVYVRDRAPSVRFPGRAYVLPRTATASIPLVSVNAPEVQVSIHRIPDAGLRSALRDQLVGSQISAYEEERISDALGEQAWTGTAEVDTRLNQDVTSALPVGEAVTGFEPGVYAMTASLPGTGDWESVATQWFIVTDLGLSTLQGDDGLHTVVRSLGSAAPKEGITLALVARSGAQLGTATTDPEGFASFPAALTRGTGGDAPALLTATGTDGDYAYLDLTGSALDLSDRGVDGRAAPPPVDVFLSTEQGIYRPGDTLHATILARDTDARAVPALPLTVITTRPDGVEHDRRVLPDAGAGGRALSLALPAGAQRGSWTIAVHADPEAPALTRSSVLVEDFVPERIDFDLDLPGGALDPAQPVPLTIEARYLYGAPGSDLGIEGELRVTPIDTVEAWPGYRFGATDEPTDPLEEFLPNGTTGPDGTARLSLNLPLPEEVTRPLEARLTVRLTDTSGRPVERRETRQIAPPVPLIGIRPLFDGAAEEGGTARFEVISLAAGGERSARDGLRWEVFRVHTDYQWYEVGGRWNYEPITTRERIADGTLDTRTDAPATLEVPVNWGHYELQVAGEQGGYARTLLGFDAGWYSAEAGTETPDLLEVSLDRDRYAPGETATLRLEPRAAGEIEVSVLAEGLIDRHTVTAQQAGPLEIALPVTEDWGPGAYVLASHIRPLDEAAGQNPARALGISWVGVDPGSRVLEARFVSAGEADPRSIHMAVLEVSGAEPGQEVWATVSAVDVGILNITGFEDPDPQGHYLGQRRLGVALRDVYGRLIDGLGGTPGLLRQGGDGGASGRQAPPPTEELVAQFSGPLRVGADGTVEVPVDLPDFNGTVRLAAVVWSADGVGQASQDLLVRDPVVVSANLPRFLAPGDRASLTLELAHVAGPAGNVQLSLTGTEAVPLPAAPQQVVLDEGGRARLSFPLAAGEVGDNRLQVAVTTADGRVLTKTLTLGIRANDPQIARQTRLDLAAGGSLDLGPDLFSGLVPGTGRLMLSAGPMAHFDVPGLLTALDTYPYGCTEQITSRALPLLYYDRLAGALDLESLAPLETRLQKAIETVLGRQARDGGFGMWYASSENLWLDAYVTDFLSRARASGHDVPEQAFEAALDNLSNQVNAASDFEEGGEGIAYALLVLAREGAASIGDLRYYADARAEAFATPLALAQLGAALASYGDPGRADAMFREASQRLDQIVAPGSGWRADYGSLARDRAGILTLAVEAGSDVIDRPQLSQAVAVSAGPSRAGSSTQEKLWTVLAAHALGADGAVEGLSLGGAPFGDTPARQLTEAELPAPLTLRNDSASEVPVVLSVFGTPATDEPAQGNGYRIERALYALDGTPVDGAQVKRNDRLVVVLRIAPERDSEARLMVEDPLPAGFEIENPNILSSGEVGGIDWLNMGDVAHYRAAETDRFTAAVDWRGTEPFRLAYVVRAVSPGEFRHPAASVEDMYRPANRARTGTGRVVVAGGE